MDKITKEEKDELLKRRIERVDKNRNYAKELFKLYYKDNVSENLKEWSMMEYKDKEKIIKQIIKWEDKAFINQAFMVHKVNIPKAMEYVNQLKVQQLKEFGIR